MRMVAEQIVKEGEGFQPQISTAAMNADQQGSLAAEKA
jgi:hypothetical protein